MSQITTTEQAIDATKVDVLPRGWSSPNAVKLPADLTTADALFLAGLDYEVTTRPLFVNPPSGEGVDEVPAFVATMRTDTEQVLGAVSPLYRVVQNADAFAIPGEGIVAAGRGRWEAAGPTKDGARAWACLTLDSEVLVDGEEIQPHVFFINDHTGGHAAVAEFWPRRVACSNMLPLSLKGAVRRVSVRHIGANVDTKIREAARIIDSADKYLATFRVTADELIGKRLGQKDLDRMLAKLYPAGTEDTDPGADARTGILEMLRGSENLGNHRGNAWGFVNAVGEYLDHGRTRRDGADRMAQLVNGSTDERVKNQALRMALAN